MKPEPTEKILRDEVRESARKIWLAGLGALALAEEEGTRLFDTLVERGSELERGEPVPVAPGGIVPASEVREPQPAYGVPEGARAQAGPRMPELIESMTPKAVPTPAMVLQARRNSEARAALVEEFGLLTSSEIADLNDSQAVNRAALASRWKGEGRIFSVRHHGQDYFPAFQFAADGRPLESVAQVLEALGQPRGWETALWFTAANGYLAGRRPVDLLENEPEAAAEAAEREGAEIYF